MVVGSILGTLTGLVGSITTSVMNFKTQKLKNKHDIAMCGLRLKEIRVSTNAKIALNKAKIDGEIELTDAMIYKDNIKEGNKEVLKASWVDRLFLMKGWASFIASPAAILITILMAVVDFMRSAMRPVLTILSCVGLYIILPDGIMAVEVVAYLASTCVTWWFGDRQSAKFINKIFEKKFQNG